MKTNNLAYLIFVGASVLLAPSLGFCSVESTLSAIQSKFINTILPLCAILGLVFAGLSFVAGSENAKNHLKLAILGAALGFLAPSLVNFIRSLVH